jgi:hypothetical protein
VTGALLVATFAVFAALMFLRRLPALLALPAMAVVVAAIVRVPFEEAMSHVIGDGAVRLAPAYVAVCAGAMLGRVMLRTGIAQDVIRRAAEFGGDRPMVVAAGLMAVTAVLFTSLTGLGAVIMVGTLVLPIMMSIGVPRKLAAVLFLLAYATGFIFNIALWRLYRELLQVAPDAALPPEVPRFATALAAVMVVVVAGYAVVAARRAPELRFWAASREPEPEPAHQPESAHALVARRRISPFAYLTPLVPLVLYVGFGWRELPAFVAGALYGVLLTEPTRAAQTLVAALLEGIADAAPAVVLMGGIGMLLNALTLDSVRDSLAPLVARLPIGEPIAYVLFFGLLSPLALYRGPLNPYGVGIGVYALMLSAGLLPALALLAAIMSVVQVQNVCDPTNTHNVWVASYTGVRVEDLTVATLPAMMLVCAGGLIVGALMFLG